MYADQILKLMLLIAILCPAERTGMSPHIDSGCDKDNFPL